VKDHPKVTVLPHLGASTLEAEDNCAVMVADQLQHYLEDGNIKHSVNFPKAKMSRNGEPRLTIAHRNEPGMIARITSILAEDNVNIAELFNNNHGDLAYTIANIDASQVNEPTLQKLQAIEHVIRLRLI
jgi:D-3-phosphoglycerate dehydrogenase